MNANEYVRGAYQSGKWAFVSDYFRLKALYEQGGVYLDTDVELLRPFGDLLELSGFAGFEDAEHVATCVLGAEKEHGFFRQAMELYEGRTFLREGGEPDLTTNVEILTSLLGRNGLEPDGARQSVMGMEIFPAEYFPPGALRPESSRKPETHMRYTGSKRPGRQARRGSTGRWRRSSVRRTPSASKSCWEGPAGRRVPAGAADSTHKRREVTAGDGGAVADVPASARIQ